MIKIKKPWYQSKTFYASVLIALGVVGQYLAGNIDVTAAITGVGAALGLFSVRDALK